MTKNLYSLAVFCGSNVGKHPIYQKAAEELGKAMATKQIRLIYGGGKVGLMGVIADAVLSGGGKVTGVITDFLWQKEVGHSDLTELIVVKTMHERKAKMEELASGFISLPGGFGTLDEFAEIFTWSQLGLHHKPIGILNTNNYFDLFLAYIDHMVIEGFLPPSNKNIILHHHHPQSLIEQMERYEPKHTSKWMDSSNV